MIAHPIAVLLVTDAIHQRRLQSLQRRSDRRGGTVQPVAQVIPLPVPARTTAPCPEPRRAS